MEWIILSKVSINGISTDGNAEVENWFQIVKHCIFKSRNNIRVIDFIRFIFTHIGDRLASFEFAYQSLGHKVFKAKEKIDLKNAKFEVLIETLPIPAKNVETDLDIVALGTIDVIFPLQTNVILRSW